MIKITDSAGKLIYEGTGPLTLATVATPAPPPPAPRPAGEVPWVGQVGNAYQNDCGPACWVMLARWMGVQATVADVLRLTGKANKLTDTWDAIDCWSKLGLSSVQGKALIEPPFMCLVKYPKLQERYLSDYTGLHWIVVTGTVKDTGGNITHVTYHDPLWQTAAQGANKRIAVTAFHAAEYGTQYRCRPGGI